MIRNFTRGENGSVLGAMGMRDHKLYVNAVSGEIPHDSPRVVQISNYNVWLANEVLKRNEEQRAIQEALEDSNLRSEAW